MKPVSSSLSRTIDIVNDALFYNQPISVPDRDTIAAWIASRQGKPNAYADMFAPTAQDMRDGLVLFTGERVTSGASLRHVSGEEACRVLTLLGSTSPDAVAALDRARNGLIARLQHCGINKDGFFCCGTCDPALWRHVILGTLPAAERWLDSGLKTLKAHRDGKRRWRRFPFYYTMLALSEVDDPRARAEIRYAAPSAERYLARPHLESIAVRRRDVLARALDQL